MIHQNLEGEEIQHLVSNQLHQMIKCNFNDRIDKIREIPEISGFLKIQ